MICKLFVNHLAYGGLFSINIGKRNINSEISGSIFPGFGTGLPVCDVIPMRGRANAATLSAHAIRLNML
jgi:hypothetical protein